MQLGASVHVSLEWWGELCTAQVRLEPVPPTGIASSLAVPLKLTLAVERVNPASLTL